VLDHLRYVESCFQTVTLQIFLQEEGLAITPSLSTATKWKPWILFSYLAYKNALSWFIDTILTYFFILCSYNVQGNKYRPGGSYMKPIRSYWIWKQKARPKRRNKCKILKDAIILYFSYHRSYKILARYNVVKQSILPSSFKRSDLVTFTKFLNTGPAVPLLSLVPTQMPQQSERNRMSPAKFAAGHWQLHMHHV